MTTPTHSEIIERAKELWFQDRLRREGAQAVEINPEIEELKEEGFLVAAQQSLMRNDSTFQDYIEKEYNETISKKTTKSDKSKAQPFTVDIEETMRSGIFICGTRQVGKTTLGFRIAKKLIELGIIVWLIDPSQAWLQFSEARRVLRIYPPRQKQQVNWNDESTLFDVSRLNPFEQRKFIENFCGNVMQVAINRTVRPKIVIVFEECHTPFYNGSMRAKANQESARLLTQGGNFNISFLAITQFPAMCDKLLVKAPQQRYAARTSEKNDKDYLRSFLGDKTEQLETLDIGEFLYFHCGNITKIKT